jgi:chromate transporter
MAASADSRPGGPNPVSLGAFVGYFLRLGAAGFGGPIALAGYMQRDLVETRGWITAEAYKEGLALAQLAPGPLAAQLAIYLGWVRAGVLGATLVSLAFIGPSFLMVIGLSALYVRFGGLSWMAGVFYGIGAAVVAIIGRSAWKLVVMTVGKDRFLGVLFGISAVVTAVTEAEFLPVILGCGLVALARRWRPGSPGPAAVASLLPLGPLAGPVSGPVSGQGTLHVVPDWVVTGLAGTASSETLWRIAGFFLEAGALVFGSGLAIVPFLRAGVVDQFHWLTDRQFLDAVAVAMITPGPVVITVAFIGYLVAGPAGALVAAIGTFLPCYLLVVLPAPYFRKYAGVPRIKAFVDGITAAATGAIAGAAFVLGKRAIFDVPTALIAGASLFAIVRFKRVPEPLVIAAAAIAGFAIKQLYHC